MLGNILAKAMLSSNVLVRSAGTAVHDNADKILLGAGIGFIVGVVFCSCLWWLRWR